MMGHRKKLIDGDEYDAFTSKKYHKWRAGVRKWIKRKSNRRQRKEPIDA